MSPKGRLASLLFAGLLLSGCGPREEAGKRSQPAGSLPVVAVTSYPLAYFAERIGGDRIEVLFPVPPGADPVFWSPAGDSVARYQQAELVLLNGAGYARWVAHATLHPERLVDTSASFRERLLPRTHAVRHAHGPEGVHDHADLASIVWLDLGLARQQAAAVRAALVRVLPDATAELDARLDALDEELARLEARLSRIGQSLSAEPLLFSHPVYEYLMAALGLRAESLHWEAAEDPGESEWRRLTARQREQPVRWLIWESPPLESSRARLRSLGIESAVFEPCGGRPSAGDFLTVMDRNASELERVAANVAVSRTGGRVAPSPDLR